MRAPTFAARPAVRWAIVAVVALGLPLAARAYLGRRVDALAARAGTALGAPVAIGAIDLDPTGALRLADVAVGGLFRADAVEAAAREIRVRRPRIAIELDGRGEATASAILERAAGRVARPRGAGGAGGAARRIVVEDGALELQLPGGALRAEGVELVPGASGARVVTGPIEVALDHRGVVARARFPRGALDLSLPTLGVRRLVLAGGGVELGGPGATTALVDASLTRGVPDASVRLRARTADGGRLSGVLAPGGDVELRAEDLPLAGLAGALPEGVDLARARFSGDLALHRGGPDHAVSLRGELRDAAIDHPLVAEAPLPIAGGVALEASGRATGGRRGVVVELLDLDLGPLHLTGHGRAELAPGRALPLRAELAIELRPMPCGALATALPGALGAPLHGFDAEGELDARARLAYDLSDAERTELEIDVDVARCRVRAEPARADVRALRVPFDLPRGDAVVRVGEGDGRVDVGRLHRHTVGAFVAAEDARFFRHAGFDLEQIRRSLAIDLGEGRLLRGGSTISQQLVKNVFVGPERTIGRKLTEAIVTWRLEALLDKSLILERYLEIIELGDGIYGLAAAARHYFGKPPEQLGVAESAFLAALTPAPRTLARRLRAAGGLDPDMVRRTEVVLRAMRIAGVIDRESFDRASPAGLRLERAAVARR